MSKSFFIYEKLQKKALNATKEGKVGIFKVWKRSSVITPELVSHILFIHKGNGFVKRIVTPDMVGHVVGEFAPTRKMGKHGKAGTS